MSPNWSFSALLDPLTYEQRFQAISKRSDSINLLTLLNYISNLNCGKCKLICYYTYTEAAILELSNEAKNIHNHLNHILFIYKYYVYRSREKHIPSTNILIDNLTEIKTKERRIQYTLLATIKQKHTIKNGIYNIQWLNNVHYEKHTGLVERGFLYCLFVLFILLVLYEQ